MNSHDSELGNRNELARIRGVRCAARRVFVAGLLGMLVALTIFRSTPAPVAAAGANDAAAVADAIERLPVVGSVLLTGAHPDDENNALLAYFARGMHLRTAYLSATRGDGGQNLLGNEQYEALGILRTEELMAARRLDGAEQFFAQAYDFGFSKDQEETLQKWGHNNVLGDYVRVIRQYRPDIIISRFTGTSADGHGHHQASGTLTNEAFTAAADPAKFSEQVREGLAPWQARWLFINRGGGGGGGRPAGADTFTVALGGFNPLYGEVLGDLGAEARSQHRSQGMGQAGRGGVYTANFSFWDAAQAGATPPKDLFEGIDLTLNRFTILAGGAPGVAQRVAAIEKSIQTAHDALSPTNPAKVLPMLAEGLGVLRELPSEISSTSVSQQSKDLALFWLQRKEEDFEHAIELAGGVKLSALADSDHVVPGGKFQVSLTGLVPEQSGLRAQQVSLTGPAGWKIEEITGNAATSNPGNGVERKFQVTVPPDAAPSQPYWLVNARSNDAFRPDPGPWIASSHQPALLKGNFQLTIADDGKQIELNRTVDVVYRFADRIYGQRESPLAVLPQLGVWLEPGIAVFPQGIKTTRAFLARVRNNSTAEQKGTLRLTLPAGWQSNPSAASFTLAARGDEASIRFEVPPPATSSTAVERQPITAVAEAGGNSYSTGYAVIDYPHIQTRYWFQPAQANLERFSVNVAPGLKVGYIMGSGDEVPNGLKQLGVEVTELTTDDLAFGDLSRFNVIVTGIRAYEVRKDISANNARLMDFVKNGGLMIVQYSRPGGFSDILAPYAMKMDSRLRVAVEEAPVEILEPANPLFHFPNEITARDFDGWVQERGTYFMANWAPEFTPLLESHDPGEPPQKGGMLVAPYGKGLYVYTGYVWFRQLPAGVPGAYRIFANMISLGKAGRR